MQSCGSGEILKLDLTKNNDELTESNIIYQAVFAIRYNYIQDEKFSKNATIEHDWSFNFKSYFIGGSDYTDRNGNGMIYGIDATSNVSLGGNTYKNVLMSFSSATNGLINSFVGKRSYYDNGRTGINFYHPDSYEAKGPPLPPLTFL